jgi:uncharacterized protein (DUF1015 family)
MSELPVRPFAARVVRRKWAARAVAPMVDARVQGDERSRAATPAKAYVDAEPAFYVYRMRRGSRDHVGVVADVRLDAFAGGGVRGHESVDDARVDALVAYYADRPARAEPVALLHGDLPEVTRLVDAVLATDPIVDFRGEDGVEHAVWRVEGEELSAAIGDGTLYVADGHHRVAARLRGWELAGRPDESGVLCVLFPPDGLALSAFHRRVAGPVDGAALLDAAREHFTVTETGDGIDVYVDGAWQTLVLTGERPVGAAGLDASLVQEHLLGPVLGIPGPPHPRLDLVPDHVPLAVLTARCDDDRGALFVLRPPSMDALIRIADLGQVMPPKTTYFSPKPYAGIFLT